MGEHIKTHNVCQWDILCLPLEDYNKKATLTILHSELTILTGLDHFK